MCGIVGCVGHEDAVGFAISGLEGLKYRGYDSMGIAFPYSDNDKPTPENEAGGDHTKMWTPSGIKVVKGLGKNGLELISEHLDPSDADATTALGHTRWGTHGSRFDISNTHPHLSESGDVAVVHNGVIENHTALKNELEAEGISFSSTTDTEVIPQLISFYLQQGESPQNAFTKAIRRLEGAYAVLAYMSQLPGTLLGARLGSSLVFGVNGSEHFASSDPSAWAGHTKKAVYLDDGEMGMVSEDEGYATWKHDKKTTRPPIASRTVSGCS